MENTPLHAQKVTILSRLIKESSLSLEEALVLLKEEEEEEVTPSTFNPGTTTPWTVPIQPYGTGISSGTITWTGGTGTTTVVPANSFFTTNTEVEPDLNN
jgi:hypothetical protein